MAPQEWLTGLMGLHVDNDKDQERSMSEISDPPNRKAFIHRWERNGDDRDITYWFCEYPKDAAFWETKPSAEWARDILNIGVTIPSIQGGPHTLRNFTVEEFNATRWVISCRGPFIYSERGSSTQSPSQDDLSESV